MKSRPKTFFDGVQSLYKPSIDKILEEKNHGTDYMRASREEYNHEKKLKELLNRTNIDMVEQLRRHRQRIKD